VITKNNGHTKFQPAFGPDPKTVTAIGEGGITCRGTGGKIQRRHQDDVKLAPSEDTTTPTQETPGQIMLEKQESRTPEESTPMLEESSLGNASNRPSRNRKPNPRYNANDYYLY
jgi:hypothetical protein